MVVRKKELKFLDEAIQEFIKNETLASFRSADDTYIALRISFDFCRDSILILQTRKVGIFANVLPESNTLVLSGERD